MFAEIINLKIKNMLIYNTTFQVDDEVHDNFLIWIKESYIPEVEKHGALRAPRICRVLSHRVTKVLPIRSNGRWMILSCCIAGIRIRVLGSTKSW